MLSNHTMSRLIHEHASKDLDSLSQALIAAANDAGGGDNISVVLVRCGGGALPPSAESHKELSRELK